MTETIWPAKSENIYYTEYLFSKMSLLYAGLIPAPGQPPPACEGADMGTRPLLEGLAIAWHDKLVDNNFFF